MKTHDPLYRRHRFPAEVIANAVWLYFRFPLSLRMVEDMLAMRGIVISHETVRRWAEKFGRDCANKIHRRAPQFGDKWHLDGVVTQSMVRNIGFGARSIRMGLLLTHWSTADATRTPRQDCCVSLCANNQELLV